MTNTVTEPEPTRPEDGMPPEVLAMRRRFERAATAAQMDGYPGLANAMGQVADALLYLNPGARIRVAGLLLGRD